MANTQDSIIQTVLQGKCVAACWGKQLVDREAGGEDVKCDEVKVFVLIRWVKSLQTYYFDNYNSITGTIAPTIDCLTAVQAAALQGKINALIKQCPQD